MIKSFFIITTFWSLLSCNQSEKRVKETAKTVNFEKLYFHTTSCDGACPVYHVEVTKDKGVRLFAEKIYKINGTTVSDDSGKMGYFVGSVTDSTFNKLIAEIQNINIDALSFDKADCCDGSITTIIIYYNGKRKFLRSMFPPPKSEKLISILNDICENSSCTKVNEPFNLESE